MEKKNVSVVPLSICITSSLYKLVHVAWYLHCFKLFFTKKYIMHLMLHEFICVVNKVLKSKFKWLEKIEMVEIMTGFKDFYGLPSIHGAIDATHIHL